MRRGVGRVVRGLVVVCVLALVVGQLLGQPVLLGFVETGSMEPTIDTGDGFVAIPSELTGDPEPGDVVVFEAEQIQGGGLTTHRVVDETPQGYVTRGDANPFTDQDGGEPYVRDAQIVATAWRVDGAVVTIPHFGTVVMALSDGLEAVQTRLAAAFGTRTLLGTSGLATAILGLSATLYVVETVRERRSASFGSRLSTDSDDGDDRVDPRLLSAGFAVLVVVAASAAMIVPAGTQSYDVVSAEFESENPLVIERGTTGEIPYAVSNGGFVPTISYVVADGEDVAVSPERVSVGSHDETAVTVSVNAPAETGHYPTYVTEYRYLYVLPAPVIDALYELHPWAPFGGIVSLLGGGTYAFGRFLAGPGDSRSRRAAVRRRCSNSRSIVRRLY
ncbi:signal peptidase I [Natrinema salaciae]|uniref:Signal peptidase, endoplasmic reticulum-type n=1 Tax=Natrinema salaciae TaxID=1186196 RepID=A0A1H9M9J9_9EURY|nr:signal peptidase I [Natrinema salaciae]SER20322.1 signal peptidase, endoplasmic reticulum-type [Natrinema salaciae]